MAKEATTKQRSAWRLCRRGISIVLSMFKALLARFLFFVHSLVAIWRVVNNTGDWRMWILAVALVALFLEFLVALNYKGGNESKWFSPVIFLYLCSAVPAIWFLEIDLLDRRLAKHTARTLALVNATLGLELDQQLSLLEENHIHTNDSRDDMSALHALGLDFRIPVVLEPNQWAKILEQMLLLILIVGRWLLPKGALSRDQLSQLLLVNIGMAADIIELFEAFGEEKVIYNRSLSMVILSLWTVSLLQFTLIQTTTKSRRVRIALTKRDSEDRRRCYFFETEIWAIMTSLLMQDLPFLCLRLILITEFKVVSYMNIFFTCKNSLITVLQIYRIVVIQTEETKRHKKLTVEKASTLSYMDEGTKTIKRVKHKYIFNVENPCISSPSSHGKYDERDNAPVTRRARLAQMDDMSTASESSIKRFNSRFSVSPNRLADRVSGSPKPVFLKNLNDNRTPTRNTVSDGEADSGLNGSIYRLV